MLRTHLTAGLLVLLSAGTACACLWDYDTLQMERARFPTTLELITGKFVRHSHDFYYWRIKDREAKLTKEPANFALRDDLAVAYDKTGQHDKAIETILVNYSKRPDRYETLANLGTFYVHVGQLEKGLEYIDKALLVNPKAHFDRERYQKYLVEYVLTRRDEKGHLVRPLARKTEDEGNPPSAANFYDFLCRKNPSWRPDMPYSLTAEEHHAAIKGVLGIMKFGNFDSPVLLEVLGDLLAPGHKYRGAMKDGKRLAARAYLKASYEVKGASERKAYRQRAGAALSMQTRSPSSHEQLPLEELEADFLRELEDARAWYEAFRAKEMATLSEPDPDAAFARLHAEEDAALAASEAAAVETALSRTRLPLLVGLGGGAVLLVLLALVVRWRRG
jgi:tetratricopeptide (TPR) repeat protein